MPSQKGFKEKLLWNLPKCDISTSFVFSHPYPDHLMGIREGFCVASVVAGQQERRCPLSAQPPTSWPPWPWSSSPSPPPWPPPSTTARTVARLPWRWGASRQLLFLYKPSLVLRWSFNGLMFLCNAPDLKDASIEMQATLHPKMHLAKSSWKLPKNSQML